eukprot:TRINITY_DN8456_c0_g1_i1.p1 TRINITY_DN8456_c0_g1~~TRINITY_DN8456_c0_g1_i1.p1  ORF type:complete len:412 (+),score=100.65 TRINITY_DN8456_c0_g1_i1:15-1250(+)
MQGKKKDKDPEEELLKFEKLEKEKPLVLPSKTSLPEKSDVIQKFSEGIERNANRINDALLKLEKLEKQLNLFDPLNEFDLLVNSWFPGLIFEAYTINDLVEEQLGKLYTTLAINRCILLISTECKKTNDWDNLCAPIAKLISEIVDIYEKNKSSPFADLLSIIAKSSRIMAWIASPTPFNHIQKIKIPVEELVGKFQKDFKGRVNYVSFAEHLIEFWRALENYVLKNHLSGLVWNQNGREPPHQLKYPKRGFPYSIPASRGITSKLFFDSVNSKWICDSLTGPKAITVVEEKDKKQTVYIKDADHATLHIKGKPATITIDGAMFSKIVVESCPNINIFNCFSISLICGGLVSSITINKSNRTTLKLLEKSENITSIVSNGSTNLILHNVDGTTEHLGNIKGRFHRGKISIL